MRSPSATSRLDRLVGGLTALAALAAATSAVAGACPTEPRAQVVADQWRQRAPIPALDIADEAQAICFRQAFVAALQPALGARIGYKVGMFSPAARKAFGIDRPRFGELYTSMLSPEGQPVPAAFGVGGVWESDLLLVVGDERINTAKSREDAYRALRGFRPFIELTSRNYADGFKPTADQITALDVGARLGVAGAEYPLVQTPEGLGALTNLSVEAIVKDAAGERTDRAVAKETLGDLLDIALYARDAVRAEGGRLKPGDLISVGVFTPSRAPAPGQVVTVRYQLLAQPVSVSAEFR